MIVRWMIFLGWLAFCFHVQGITGLWTGFLLFGLAAFVWYMVFDTWNRLKSTLGAAVSRPSVTNQTLNLHMTPDDVQAMRGVRERETTDDFAGMIEYRSHKK